MKPINIAVLGSTRGTVLEPIIKAIDSNELTANISVVISNKAEAYILERAKQHHLQAEHIAAKGLKRTEYDNLITEKLKQYNVDIILLIGYMRLLSKEFVHSWQHKILNIHPSLLPEFSGLMDLEVHQAVLDAGKKQTGCTVHYVEEEVDAGPIVIQKTCEVRTDDTAETLKARVQALEGEALIAAIKATYC